jgi:fucose 4-O-acetylase-like acetyltransferase
MNKRVQFLDIAKGLGILLVIYGHVYTPLKDYIYSFHMPLFVFISGIFFKEGVDAKKFFVSKVNRILVPYFFFSLVTWCIFTAVSYKQEDATAFHKQITNVAKIFIGSGTNGNVALWFLGTLFVVTTIYYFITLLVSNTIGRSIIVLLMSVAGYIFFKRNMALPNIADSTCSLILFFHIGYLGRKFILEYNNKLAAILATVVCFLGMVVLTPLNISLTGIKFVDTANNMLGNYFIFYTGALMGTMLIVCVSWLINRNNFLVFLGTNSLIIMGVQLPIIALVDYFLMTNNISRNTTLTGIGEFVLVTVLSLGLVKLFNTYLPKLVGTEALIEYPKTKGTVVTG